jgi:hypothetical protein
MGRHEKDAHDPLCPHMGMPCRCDFIARVRADERARWSPPAPATPGHVSYCWCPTCGDPCAGLEVQE